MKYKFINSQYRKYKRIAERVTIFIFVAWLAFILFINLSDESFSFLYTLGSILVLLSLTLLSHYQNNVMPYNNPEKYFFEVNEEFCILSHPDNKKNNDLPEKFEFKVKNITNIEFKSIDGFENIKLRIENPNKPLSYNIVTVWGFENMRQIADEIRKLAEL